MTETINESKFQYRAACEESGTGPNGLTGELTAIDHVDELETAEIKEILINGADDETRDSLYTRYLQSFSMESFGGNIAQYKEHGDEEKMKKAAGQIVMFTFATAVVELSCRCLL